MSKNIADKIKGHAERGNMAGVASEADRAAAQIETFRKALAARDARIAEMTEALEGYRRMVFGGWSEPAGVPVNGACLFDDDVQRHLPAHEIAALRRRGVEVGEVDGGSDQ